MKLSLTGSDSWKLYLLLILTFVNWGIEARKWQILMLTLEKTTWWRAMKASLSGVAFAINTPNRIGEYGGRVLYVKEGHRIQAVSLAIAGSFSQLIITFMMGCFGLVYFLNFVPHNISKSWPSYQFWIRITLAGGSVVTVLCLLLYFRLSWLTKSIEKIPRIGKRIHQIAILEELGVTRLLRVFALSFIRYCVFIFQYILILQLMDVDMNSWQIAWTVSVMFLILALIPTIALAEVGIRGQLSIQLFGLFTTNNVGVIAGTIGIWFINLVVPAIVGSLLILGIKIYSGKDQ
ncbi:lysylphosphatidylglycerol synthase transmembrane domain-containing protein [Pinibacter aurantiacus]|uniref:Flippase-like domain-containing protein n=1 Tax=Pinibacter aurantiacus TaxID=2851599 RepID=A0A9E2S7P8_9BACT|nr:lysylphosphatidylglycerol synthase transmembrane domain-containing protein [Pinibacter aurantiacus]MBV4356488.1 flippase-like domain-containing protein [Pinibacter aurantiacus]